MPNNDSNKDHGPATLDRRKFLITVGLGLAATSLLLRMATSAHAQADRKPVGVGPRSTALPRRRLGALEVSAIGLGCMSMTSGTYNPPRRTVLMRGQTLLSDICPNNACASGR